MAGEAPGVLQGKVVLVTGAGGGIGREIALLAGAEGAKVVVNDIGATVGGQERNAGPAEEVAGLICAAGGEAVANAGSVADEAEARAMVEQAVQHYGRIDAVINNAGNYRVAPLDETDAAFFDSIVKVHLYGTFNVSRAAIGHFKAQGGGVFLHTTSSAGLIGANGLLAYSSAKGGIVSLSRSIAIDMAQYGVRSNCIAPSAVSRMSTAGMNSRKGPQRAASSLGGRSAQAAQVAPLALFLVSDLAAKITGQIIGVRANELYLYGQPRPLRVLQRSEGWTARQIGEQLPSAWASGLVPLETFLDVFSWPPQ